MAKEKNKKCDTPLCKECGGRTALISGHFYWYQDSEPYLNGIKEEAVISEGESWIHGYVCDECGTVQGLWYE